MDKGNEKAKTGRKSDSNKGEKRRETKSKRKNRLRYSKFNPKTKSFGPKAERRDEIQPQDLSKYTESQKLEALNSIASMVMQSPETSLSLLADLFVLLQDDSTTVIIQGLNKLCDVFLDILPTYKIRVAKETPEGEEVKLSKEVQELRGYESNLLENYAKYLRILQAFLKVKSKKVKGTEAKSCVTKIKEVAFDCICRFLENIPHMNYTKSIMQVITSKLCSNNETMRKRSMVAVRDMFSSLEHSASMLELKLRTVRTIGKLIKGKSHVSFDRTLLSLFQEHKLIVEKSEAQSKMNPKIEELRLAIKKKKGKGKKQDSKGLEKALLKELKETSAITADVAQINRYNTDILKEVLAIYLGILKENPKSPLMASVFEGLPYFAPHIDIEIVSDCLAVIKSYLKTAFVTGESNLLNLSSALACALKMAHTIGSTFDIDERSFLSYAFKFLDFFITKQTEATEPEVFSSFLNSLNSLFIEKKQLSMDVMAAFCKKIVAVALKVKVEVCLKLLEIINEIMKKYAKMRSLLETDESTVEPHIFLDKLIDPQFCVTASTISIANELKEIKEKFFKESKEILNGVKEIMSHK